MYKKKIQNNSPFFKMKKCIFMIFVVVAVVVNKCDLNEAKQNI